MSTQVGDSGSPLIVKPLGMNELCYIIGLHRSGKKNENGGSKAIRITKKIIDKLAIMEKKLYGDDTSNVELFSLNFQKIKDKPL